MSEQLQVGQPIVKDNFTMEPHFRDYLLKLASSIRAYRDESSTTYTLVEGDENQVIRFTGASPAVTIPTGLFRESRIIGIRQAGTGTLTLDATGLTINGTLPTWTQHTELMLRKVGDDEFDVI